MIIKFCNRKEYLPIVIHEKARLKALEAFKQI